MTARDTLTALSVQKQYGQFFVKCPACEGHKDRRPRCAVCAKTGKVTERGAEQFLEREGAVA